MRVDSLIRRLVIMLSWCEHIAFEWCELVFGRWPQKKYRSKITRQSKIKNVLSKQKIILYLNPRMPIMKFLWNSSNGNKSSMLGNKKIYFLNSASVRRRKSFFRYWNGKQVELVAFVVSIARPDYVCAGKGRKWIRKNSGNLINWIVKWMHVKGALPFAESAMGVWSSRLR